MKNTIIWGESVEQGRHTDVIIYNNFFFSGEKKCETMMIVYMNTRRDSDSELQKAKCYFFSQS